jgi:hypothetical protein
MCAYHRPSSIEDEDNSGGSELVGQPNSSNDGDRATWRTMSNEE